MSPEQASGAEATTASDVYALGVIGYEMLAGHPLFTAESAGALAMAHVHQPPPPLPSTIPSPVRDLIMEALSKNPKDRPNDAQVFASKLRRLQLTNMPPPGGTSAKQSDEQSSAPTQMMTAVGDGSRTAIMPVAAIAGIAAMPTRVPNLLGNARHISPRRRRRRVVVLVAASLIAAVAVGAMIVNGGQLPTSEATTPTATQISIAGATIDSKVLIGKTFAQATAILTKAGYVVNTKSVAVPGVVNGLVVAVQPSGAVPFGSTITLSVTGPVSSTTTTTLRSTTTPVAVVITSKPHGKHKP
jgi:serine/threonine-protein kinase